MLMQGWEKGQGIVHCHLSIFDILFIGRCLGCGSPFKYKFKITEMFDTAVGSVGSVIN